MSMVLTVRLFTFGRWEMTAATGKYIFDRHGGDGHHRNHHWNYRAIVPIFSIIISNMVTVRLWPCDPSMESPDRHHLAFTIHSLDNSICTVSALPQWIRCLFLSAVCFLSTIRVPSLCVLATVSSLYIPFWFEVVSCTLSIGSGLNPSRDCTEWFNSI